MQPDYVFNYASQNLPNVKAASLRVKAAQKNTLVAKASFYPTISFGYNLTSNFTKTNFVNLKKFVSPVSRKLLNN